MQLHLNGIEVKEYLSTSQEVNQDAKESDSYIFLTHSEKHGSTQCCQEDPSHPFRHLGMVLHSIGEEREPFWFR